MELDVKRGVVPPLLAVLLLVGIVHLTSGKPTFLQKGRKPSTELDSQQARPLAFASVPHLPSAALRVGQMLKQEGKGSELSSKSKARNVPFLRNKRQVPWDQLYEHLQAVLSQQTTPPPVAEPEVPPDFPCCFPG